MWFAAEGNRSFFFLLNGQHCGFEIEFPPHIHHTITLIDFLSMCTFIEEIILFICTLFLAVGDMCLEDADCRELSVSYTKAAMVCFLKECICSASHEQHDQYCVKRSKFIEQITKGVCVYVCIYTTLPQIIFFPTRIHVCVCSKAYRECGLCYWQSSFVYYFSAEHSICIYIFS